MIASEDKFPFWVFNTSDTRRITFPEICIQAYVQSPIPPTYKPVPASPEEKQRGVGRVSGVGISQTLALDVDTCKHGSPAPVAVVLALGC